MAHEMTNYDGLALASKAAWHGLGTVVPDGFTPREGMKIAGIEWGVESQPLYRQAGWYPDGNPRYVLVPTHVANVRDDRDPEEQLLGVVGANYQAIQNWEVADFCEALGRAGGIRCETVGSIREGRRVWFLLRGDTYWPARYRADEINRYLLVSNGHDGSQSVSITPTDIRVVCANTHYAATGGDENGELRNACYRWRHTAGLKNRVEEAREAIEMYLQAGKATQAQVDHLAARDINQAAMLAFFTRAYVETLGTVHENPKNETEERAQKKAMSALESFTRRWDDEAPLSGRTMWTAYNAFTGLVQHDMKARGKDDSDRVAKRQESNLFGLNSDRTRRVFALALAE